MTGILQPGQLLGRYKVLRLLGSGAMGDVYLAEDPQIERRLAIKTVRVADGRAAEVEDRKRRLLREAKAAGRIVHPHVTTLFDAGEADGLLYLAFEFVDGADLAQRIEQVPPLSLGQVLRIVRETALALDAAHQHGIVHRDIKPSNILLDRQGRVKVADFGIARVAGQATELTMTGSVVGSPHYLSPEQVRGDELDGRTDVFSLGVVLYELIGRQRPFNGETLTTLVYQILHKEPEPIPDLRTGLNPRVSELLGRMLAKDRDQRFRTAGEVAEEIGRLERELPPQLLGAPAREAQDDVDATMLMPSGSFSVPPPPVPAPASGSGGTAATAYGPEPVTAVVGSATTQSRPMPTTLGVPPPPAPMSATRSTPPPPPVAATGSGGSKLWLILGAVAFFGLAIVGGGGYFVWLRMKAPPAGPQTPGQEVPGQVVANDPASPANPSQTTPANPAPSTPSQTTPSQPANTEPQRPNPTAPATEPRRDPAPSRPEPVPNRVDPAPAPVPTRPAQHPPTTPTPSPPTAPVQEPEPEPERPTVASVNADREMDTGLSLLFEVQPDDAFLLLRAPDERRSASLGKASDYKGGREGRPYQLPNAGDWVLTIRREGSDDVVLLLHAEAGRGTTRIRHTFGGASAASGGKPAGAIRVKQGVNFKGNSETARVSVDGTDRGIVRDFSGRKFLELEPGIHRITVSVPGKGSEEFEVQVGPTAPKDRETLRFEIR